MCLLLSVLAEHIEQMPTPGSCHGGWALRAALLVSKDSFLTQERKTHGEGRLLTGTQTDRARDLRYPSFFIFHQCLNSDETDVKEPVTGGDGFQTRAICWHKPPSSSCG